MSDEPKNTTVVPMYPGYPVFVDEPDQDVIKMLENALARARKGEIRSICVVGLLQNGNLYRNWVIGEAQRLALLGATDVVRALLADRYLSISDEVDIDALMPAEAPPDLPA